VGDLTRRQFIGRTLITGATIAAGGLSTISTTPVKVVPKTMVWKNLNVLSPKAKAYRGFLKGLIGGAVTGNDPAGASDLRTSTKTLLTKHSEYNPKTGNIERVKSSYGRSAFETAIKKPEGSWTKMEAKQGVGNPGARNIAIDMKSNPRERKQGFMDPKNSSAGKESRKLTSRLHRGARQYQADELKAYRKANPNSRQALAELKVRREFQAQDKVKKSDFYKLKPSLQTKVRKEFQAQDKHTPNIQATKTTSTTSKGGGKSAGGGGGKFGSGLYGRHSPWSLLRSDKNF